MGSAGRRDRDGEMGRSEIGQLRAEVFSEMRSNFRWTIATMITLFGIAVPVWMWVLGRIVKGL